VDTSHRVDSVGRTSHPDACKGRAALAPAVTVTVKRTLAARPEPRLLCPFPGNGATDGHGEVELIDGGGKTRKMLGYGRLTHRRCMKSIS
jgi:hypothetical protein